MAGRRSGAIGDALAQQAGRPQDEHRAQDRTRSGYPPDFDEDALCSLLDAEPHLTTREIAATLGCTHGTVEYHLHKLGKVQKLGIWVPHILTENNMHQRLTVCSSLLTRHNQEPFLDRIVTGDEKWVLYINLQRKPQWIDKDQKPKLTPKLSIHPKKVMLCVWWNSSGIIHHELLPTNTTITATLYRDQLGRVVTKLVIQRPSLVNRKRVNLLHDNARPHVAKMAHEKIVQLGWEVLPHPPYPPDLAPSDHYLFQSLQQQLWTKNFENYDELKTFLNTFLNSKSTSIYRNGIEMLVGKWQRVVDCNGDYFAD